MAVGSATEPEMTLDTALGISFSYRWLAKLTAHDESDTSDDDAQNTEAISKEEPSSPAGGEPYPCHPGAESHVRSGFGGAIWR